MSKNAGISSWDINVNYNKHSFPIPEPIGFNLNYKETIHPKSKLKEICVMKTNKAKELATGQLKQVFMTLLTFYFVGSNMSIFTIFFVGMYGYNSLNAIFGVNNSKY